MSTSSLSEPPRPSGTGGVAERGASGGVAAQAGSPRAPGGRWVVGPGAEGSPARAPGGRNVVGPGVDAGL